MRIALEFKYMLAVRHDPMTWIIYVRGRRRGVGGRLRLKPAAPAIVPRGDLASAIDMNVTVS
jgi:hypothetical protein